MRLRVRGRRPARRASDGFRNRWSSIRSRRRLPPDMLERYAESGLAPPVVDGDMEAIAAPSTSSASTTTRAMSFDPVERTARTLVEPEGVERTEMGWEVYPDGSPTPRPAPRGVRSPPLYITENGASFPTTGPTEGLTPARPTSSVTSVRWQMRSSAGSPARLLRLVAPRQLRVGVRLHAQLRHRLHRLRDARTGAQGELQLVPGLHLRSARRPPSVRV